MLEPNEPTSVSSDISSSTQSSPTTTTATTSSAGVATGGGASVELTLSAVKEFLVLNGGKVKYADLYNQFRDLIVDSTTDDKFQEFVSNIAVKKFENDSKDEWIQLKKKYMGSNPNSPPHMGFFASKLQKTKHNLTKFSNKAFSSRESGKQTPPRSPQLPINQPPPSHPSNNVENNISSSNNLSSSSLKFRSASNSSSHRASRNNSSAASTTADISSLSSSLGQLVKSALTGVAAVTASSEKINKAGNRNSVFFGLGGGVSRDISRSFLPSSVLNHKSVDNLNIERFDQPNSRRSSSLGVLDNTVVLLSSSINNSTLVESPIAGGLQASGNSTRRIPNDESLSSSRLDQTVVVDHSTNIKSVKEHAKKLNRLNTESELKHLNNNNNNGDGMPSTSNKTSGKSTGKNVDLNESTSSAKFKADLESIDISDPKPHEKEWILWCSRGDYHEIAKMLSKQPYLAQRKDPFNGYTCAHWACKHGNMEILKLLATVLDYDTKTNPKGIKINHLVNSRTRSGYTCLHMAYLCNHSEMVPLLKNYGAEPIRDFNGKNGIDYSRSSGGNQDPNHQTIIEFNESKLGEMLNDANTLIKRSSSAIMPKSKNSKDEKESGFLSVKESRSNRPKVSITGTMIESPFHRFGGKSTTNTNSSTSTTTTTTSTAPANNSTNTIAQLVHNLPHSSLPLNQLNTENNNNSSNNNKKFNVLMMPPANKSANVLKSMDNTNNNNNKSLSESDDPSDVGHNVIDATITEVDGETTTSTTASSLRESKENLEFI